MRFGLSTFHFYIIPVIYWVDTVMSGEGGDQEAVQAPDQQQAQIRFQAAQEYAHAQSQSQQAAQQYAASMAAAQAAQQLLGQVPPGLLQAQIQPVPGDLDTAQTYHDATIAQAARQLSFKAPRGFSGYDDDWDRFQVRFKSFVMSSHWMYDGLFKMAEAAGETTIDDELQVSKDQLALSKMLYNALVQLCEGPAIRLVQRQDNSNGIETWRKLYNRYNASTRSRATGRITKIIQWKFDMNNFETSFNDWEAEISKYETEQGQSITDDVNIGILFANTKGHGGQYIHKHLIFNTDVQMPYSKVRQILNNYFTSGRVVRYSQSYSRTKTDGPEPMEIDASWRCI
jgi:hypothetical protein